MDIATWLRELGLGRYEQAFRDNDIVPEALDQLTDEDLKELGVSLGHRRVLLKAIRRLPGQPSERDAAKVAPADSPEPIRSRESEAERRQLTVMFVDLVGSTELSGRLDPEDMAQTIGTYQRCCAEGVRRWNGHLAKYMGDGVLAYFGWPQAHEDDAERAVRAGLGIVDAVGRLAASDGTPLRARIGIATGLVMVGDLIGEGAAQEQTVVGETPNLAARLQALAEPGAVVITEGTRRLLGGLFEYRDLGRQELKGFAAPIQAWRVAGESAAESRFEALRGEQLTSLVGREHEIGLLADRWERAREGEGQVVLLSGEPGIGKSRIIWALREHVARKPHTPLGHYCSPHHTNSALYPVIGLLERAAGFGRGDPDDAKLEKLEAALAPAAEPLGEAVPLLAALLGIDVGDRYPVKALSPQRQKQRTLEVLADQVVGLASRQPVLAIYEDAHWIDPTTLEALDMIVERVQRLPVLVLITFRPEFTPPWGGHVHVTQLSLSRLTRRHGQAIVEQVTGGKTLPAEVIDQIIAKTDGVPLFVEELTKTVLDSGLLTDAGDHYALAGHLAPLAIPSSLHDSLMARLDHISPARETAQIGAVIGRRFDHKLLAAVSPLPDGNLGEALEQLVDSELVFRRGSPPDAAYTFKHALVQDAAYQSLLKAKRQQLHGHVAEALRDHFPDVKERQPEILAYHFSEAGLAEAAVPYFFLAGKRAAQNSATREAESHLRQGIEQLEKLPKTPERDQLELSLRTWLASIFLMTRGPQSKESLSTHEFVRELAEKIDDPESACFALHGVWQSYSTGIVRHGRAADVARSMLAIAQKQKDARINLIMAHRYLRSSTFFLGDIESAREEYRSAVDLFNDESAEGDFIFYSFDIMAATKAIWSLVQWVAGYPDQSERIAAEALRRATAIKHAHTEAFVLHYSYNTLLTLRSQFGSAYEFTRRSIDLAREHGFPHWLGLAKVLSGAAAVRAGTDRSGCRLALEGLKDLDEAGLQMSRSFFLAVTASAHAEIGEIEAANTRLREAHECNRASDERWAEAEVCRIEGDILALQERLGDAETCYRRGIEIAREQGARSWELRASTSLARLWRDQGKREQARDVLATIYGWFTEGHETADLKQAKALLDSLS